MSNKAYCASRDLRPPTATLYRRLGIAVAIGIDPDSVLFKHLSQSAHASISQVARAIEAPGATPESVEGVLRRYVNEDGMRIRG